MKLSAREESDRVLAAVVSCINSGHHFILEAGAGAGKTYSLVQTLLYLLSADKAARSPAERIACITYTNVARDEIRRRIDSDPRVFCHTIHGFAWELLAPFQGPIRRSLKQNAKWIERQENQEAIDEQPVKYALGIPRITPREVTLHHNDVIWLFAEFLKEQKFRQVMRSHYSRIFIDEYQDANKILMESIKENVFTRTTDVPLVGLFGDHWQQIYGDACGKVVHAGLAAIPKGANFRSSPVVVEVLNRMRPELPQVPDRENAEGNVIALHCNSWTGERLSGGHWKGDLPQEVASQFISKAREMLGSQGPGEASAKYKILMLTHRSLAAEQGYPSIPDVYDYNDIFRNLQDPHLAYFVEQLEPAIASYSRKRYGPMFDALRVNAPVVTSMARKTQIADDLDRLVALRSEGTVADVVKFLNEREFPHLPADVLRREDRLLKAVASGEDLGRTLTSTEKLRATPYSEIISFAKFHHEQSPYATQHGVKGAEFDNVLVIVGRGWSLYNFAQMLAWADLPATSPELQSPAYIRNRNLFYVACSRARDRLAVLFTQELPDPALSTVARWFGSSNVVGLDV